MTSDIIPKDQFEVYKNLIKTKEEANSEIVSIDSIVLSALGGGALTGISGYWNLYAGIGVGILAVYNTGKQIKSRIKHIKKYNKIVKELNDLESTLSNYKKE